MLSVGVPFGPPLLVQGKGEGEVTRSDPRHTLRPQPLTFHATTAPTYRFRLAAGAIAAYAALTAADWAASRHSTNCPPFMMTSNLVRS